MVLLRAKSISVRDFVLSELNLSVVETSTIERIQHSNKSFSWSFTSTIPRAAGGPSPIGMLSSRAISLDIRILSEVMPVSARIFLATRCTSS